MTIKYFAVDHQTLAVSEVSLDTIYTQTNLPPSIYKINTDLINMTKEEFEKYLQGYHQHPDEYVGISGISKF